MLDAAENAKLKGEALTEARFYANLYVALYYESEGDAKKCLEHLTDGGGEVQDRPLHVGRGRRAPEAAEGEEVSDEQPQMHDR